MSLTYKEKQIKSFSVENKHSGRFRERRPKTRDTGLGMTIGGHVQGGHYETGLLLTYQEVVGSR